MSDYKQIQERSSDKYIQTAPNAKLYVKDYGSGKPVI